MLAAVLLVAPAPADAQTDAPTLDLLPYIGQGDAFNCADFAPQADAQAVLRAGPTDPNLLGSDRRCANAARRHAMIVIPSMTLNGEGALPNPAVESPRPGRAHRRTSRGRASRWS